MAPPHNTQNEPPPAEKGAQSGRPLVVDLRREARERDSVSAKALYSFLFDFAPRKLEALVRRERVCLLGLDERSGLVACRRLRLWSPEVGLQRANGGL